MLKTNSRGRSPSGAPNPIDVHVGSRVRLRRTLLGMSQEKLAEAIGITFQQVQKYERGANRIGASRLFDLSVALGTPVTFFFEDMPESASRLSPRQIDKALIGEAEEPATLPNDPVFKRETLELIRAYFGIDNADLRKRVLDLAKTLAAHADAGQRAG